MNEQEAKLQEERLQKYRELAFLRGQLYSALQIITEPHKEGPCGQGPFTGNTRESRQVRELQVFFSSTRGGAPAVELNIPNLNIEAWELGRALESILRAKIKLIGVEMEKI